MTNDSNKIVVTIDNYLDSHYTHRSNWLRAAVLGANDEIKHAETRSRNNIPATENGNNEKVKMTYK